MKDICVIVLFICVYVYGSPVSIPNEEIQNEEIIRTKIEEIAVKPNDRLEGTRIGPVAQLIDDIFNPGNLHCRDAFEYPINLPHSAPIASYGRLFFTGFQYRYKGLLFVKNNNLDFILKHIHQILISGGGLRATYYLYKIRFISPSRHTLVGARFSMEIQYICINTKYSTYSAAKSNPDGVAIFVVFVVIGTQYNLAYEKIEKGMKHLTGKPPSYELESYFSPASLLPNNTCSFFRYHGKLSKDSCNQIITWTVFTDPIEVTSEQILSIEDSINPRILDINEDPSESFRHQRAFNSTYSNYSRHPIVTVQPRIYCGVPFSNFYENPWFFYHKYL